MTSDSINSAAKSADPEMIMRAGGDLDQYGTDEDRRNKIVRALEIGAVTTEIAFLGGVIRYAGFAGVLATTKDTALSAAYLAGSTAVVEGSAAVSMTDILNRNQGENKGRVFKRIDSTLDKITPKGTRISPLAATVITNYAGISTLLLAKQREKPDRSFRENLKTGLIGTGILTGACAVQGALIAEGVTDITEPKVVAPVLGVFALSLYAVKSAKNKLKKNYEY